MVSKKTNKPKRRWLSKARYAAKKRKEELHETEKAKPVKLTPEEEQDCYVYHVENADKKGIYVGYTTTPKKRIRQHNGELVGGARRTKAHRPWSFGFVMQFPKTWFDKIHAQQLEYACKRFGKKRKQRKPRLEYLPKALPGHPALSQRIDHVIWACHNCTQFTSNFPKYDPQNAQHTLHIYLLDEFVDIVKPLFASVPYWKPVVLPLSVLLS